MLNFEKYKEAIKGISINSFAMKDGKVKVCEEIPCRECDFHDENCSCGAKKTYWLYKEYKPSKIKIPRATKVALENLDECWSYLAKDKDGSVFVYTNKPEKHNTTWVGNTLHSLNAFNSKLFLFLSWEDEEPTSIKELLENCEVIEDE